MGPTTQGPLVSLNFVSREASLWCLLYLQPRSHHHSTWISALTTTERTWACLLNWRYTVVLKPKPGEWPLPKVPANSPTGPRTTEAEKNGGLRVNGPALSTIPREGPAVTHKSNCGPRGEDTQRHEAGKRHHPSTPKVLRAKPITSPQSEQGPGKVPFSFYHQPDQLAAVLTGSWAGKENPNGSKVPDRKPISLQQTSEAWKQAALAFFDQPDEPEPDSGSSASRNPE